MRRSGLIGVVTAAGVALSCASGPRGVVMNQFIPADKLMAVHICATTAQQLVAELGAPNGQGRDGDMGTLNWVAAGVVTENSETTVGTQSVYAWIDGEGFVAGFVVNPASIPVKPTSCREQHPSDDDTPSAPVVEPKRKTDA